MNRSTHIVVATLSILMLLAPSDGCALEPDGGNGRAGEPTRGGGGTAASDAGPSAGASGLGGAGGKASADGGTTTGRDAQDGSVEAGDASGADSGGSPYANFATTREIVLFKCGGAGCHSGEREPRLVDEAKLYSTLTTYVAQRCGNRLLVKPGSPEESAFYLAQKGLCGTNLPQMPLGCVDNCTPPDYLEGVRQWIANGASQH